MQKQINKLDFSGQNIYSGIDVHLNDWKVTIMVGERFHKTFTQPPVPEKLYNYLLKNFPGGTYYAAYEAGFCGFWIQRQLASFGINTIIANPADIPTTDKEKRQKEDKRDSRKIAKALKNNNLEAIYIPSANALEDRFLVRVRYTIAKDLRRCKHRVKSFLHFHGIKIPEEFSVQNGYWSKRFTLWLESIELKRTSGNIALTSILSQVESLRAQLLKVTRQVRALSRQPQYQRNCKLLISIPGVGLLTAMRFLTEVIDIRRFNNIHQLASYVGLIPSTNSSGSKERAGDITPRGNNALRTALIESSWRAISKDPALMAKYYKLCKRMKGNKAIVK
jgi:transposase